MFDVTVARKEKIADSDNIPDSRAANAPAIDISLVFFFGVRLHILGQLSVRAVNSGRKPARGPHPTL